MVPGYSSYSWRLSKNTQGASTKVGNTAPQINRMLFPNSCEMKGNWQSITGRLPSFAILLLLLLFLFTLQLPFTPIRPSSVHARIVIVKCSPKVKTTFWPFLPFTPGTNGRSSSLFPPIPFRISFPANSICCLSRCHYSTALESGRSCARLVFVPS